MSLLALNTPQAAFFFLCKSVQMFTMEMLPFLLIYEGKTERSLPKEEFRREAERGGHVFVTTKNHWMVVDSAKKYIEKIVKPHYEKMLL